MVIGFALELEQFGEAHQGGVHIKFGKGLAGGQNGVELGHAFEEALELWLALERNAVAGTGELAGEAQEHYGIAKALLGVEQEAASFEGIARPFGGVEFGFLFLAGFPAKFVIAPAFGEVAEHEAGEAVVPAEVGVVGLVVECLAIFHERFGHAILFLQNPAEIDGGIAGFGVNEQFLLEARLGGGDVAEELVGIGHAEVDAVGGGFSAGSGFEMFEGFGGADLLEAGGAEVVAQLGGIGAEVEHAGVHGHSKIQLSHLLKEEAEFLERLGVTQVARGTAVFNFRVDSHNTTS